MNAEGFRNHLKTLAKRCGGQNRLAVQLGVNTGYLCHLIKGRRLPGPQILDALGLEERVRYVKRGAR